MVVAGQRVAKVWVVSARSPAPRFPASVVPVAGSSISAAPIVAFVSETDAITYAQNYVQGGTVKAVLLFENLAELPEVVNAQA